MGHVSIKTSSTRLSGRITVTLRARKYLRDLHEELGEQVLLLSWPGGATCLPADVYDPGPYNVIVGHIARCPVYTDLRQLAIYDDRSLVLDASGSALPAGNAVLCTVPVPHL
jgi:uncharacterized protein (DUF779 family)